MQVGQFKFAFVLVIVFAATLVYFYALRYQDRNEKQPPFSVKTSYQNASDHAPTNHRTSGDQPPTNTGNISLLVRMPASSQEQLRRLYCYMLRTTVLYWPASLGKIVIVLDDESQQDHQFDKVIRAQMPKYFPDYKLDIMYEPLPKNPNTLSFPGSPMGSGYNRQIFSSFLFDLYTTDPVIAWMDTDIAFISPVMKSSIFSNGKIRVLGIECLINKNSAYIVWARGTEIALGLPAVADFSVIFPAYVYRDTYTNCREFLLKRFHTDDFEVAFRKFYNGNKINPADVVLTYAWYFERERYSWDIRACTELEALNKKLPVGHNIRLEDVGVIVRQPINALHVPYQPISPTIITDSYCLAQAAAGNKDEICANRELSLSNSFERLNYDPMPRTKVMCDGELRSLCLRALARYFAQVGGEIKEKKLYLDWRVVAKAESLASEAGFKCDPIGSAARGL